MASASRDQSKGLTVPGNADTLDPYQLMAVLGKKVIHPGGQRSTEELFAIARLEPTDRVLEVGCGVGTTAIAVAARFGAQLTAVDVDPMMIELAGENVRKAGCADQVRVLQADILNLPFEAGEFDCVLVEAVTMFVDRPQALSEILRVVKPAGRVLDHEFIWRTRPPKKVQDCFASQLCPGVTFDTVEEWVSLYQNAGLSDIQTVTGPFAMMTAPGFLRDEGILNTLAIWGRMFSRRAYLRRMMWLMPKMLTVRPYLGYVILAGTKAS
jgi:SAM-dependent methyltransferase